MGLWEGWKSEQEEFLVGKRRCCWHCSGWRRGMNSSRLPQQSLLPPESRI